MTHTLPICLKATGEYFNVPYVLETTVADLIEYVCSQCKILLNTNSNDYYMAIDKNEMLNNDRTVGEIGLDQPNRYNFLHVCIKTSVLIKQINQSHMKYHPIPSNRLPVKLKNRNTTEQSNDINMKQKRGPSTSVNQQQVLKNTELISNESTMVKEVHILICGGPKVGKSTLINALCGCPVAKTNTLALDQCTKKISSYQLDNIHFWDTPGIQQWSHLDIDSYLNSSPQRQTPLCMFYCASPGSFAKLQQLDMLLDGCITRRDIFCILVVTNMYAHINRRAILEEFKTLLNKYVDQSDQIREENGVWFYGNIGLCTMVNSQEYIDEDTNRRYAQQGINELVLAVTKSFSGTHQLDGWLRTIERNQQFWLNYQEQLYQLTQKPNELCLTDLVKNN